MPCSTSLRRATASRPRTARTITIYCHGAALREIALRDATWFGVVTGPDAALAFVETRGRVALAPPGLLLALLPRGDSRVEQATMATKTATKPKGRGTPQRDMAFASEARYGRAMAMSRADAFLIPLITGEVGIPMEGMYVLGTLPGAAGALGERVVRYRDMFQRTGAAVGAQVLDVEARLARSVITPPARPDSYPLYVRWSDEVVRLVASVTGPEMPEGALAALGRIAGELMQTVATHIAVLDLRELAPDHAVLLLHHTQLTARTAKHIERLQGIAKFPSLPAEVVPQAARLATLARMAGALNRNTELGTQAQASGLKLAAGQLGTTIGAVRALVDA